MSASMLALWSCGLFFLTGLLTGVWKYAQIALEWQRVASVYGLVSLVTFALYGLDKRAARRGAWRTAEAHLHFFELFGGWPGALLAQRLFRHKTRKASFRAVFVLTIIANLAALGWLLYAQSGQELRGLLGVSRVDFGAWGILP